MLRRRHTPALTAVPINTTLLPNSFRKRTTAIQQQALCSPILGQEVSLIRSTMAPIPHSYDVNVSASDENDCLCKEPSKRMRDVLLPITRGGSFFQDPFFSDVHHQFDATVRRVLGRWRDNDLKLRDRWDDSCRYSDILKSYRHHRSLDLREEDQAVAVGSDKAGHKIVVDVHDFADGDVKVKAVGEELVVEGRVEKSEEGGSSVSSHSFTRRFSLPHFTDMAAIASVMSSDGILTITASKMEDQLHQKTTIIPIKLEDKNQDSKLSQTSDINEVSSVASSDEVESGCASKGIIEQNVLMNQENVNIPSNARKVPINISLQPRSVEIQISNENINEDIGKQKNSIKTIEKAKPISEEPSFKASVSGHPEEDLAITVTSDRTSHKITMDVHAFLDGKVKVRVVGEKELLVEGCLEKPEGRSSISSHSFRRRFSLPHLTDMTAITSAMSSDGILTITAPKLSDNEMEHLQESKDISEMKRICTQGESNDINGSLCIKKPKSSDSENLSLAVTKMGPFFRDSFFKEQVEDFRKAIREILTRWGEESWVVDDLTRYRLLRSQDLREETQAVTSSEDDRHHKFVIDVHDFTDGGAMSVKAVNDRELVVEGQLEKKEDDSKSTKRFLRRFVVPGDIELDSVTSVVSSDGVLTVSAPKKQKPFVSLTTDTKETRNTCQRPTESIEPTSHSQQESQRKGAIVPIQLEDTDKVSAPLAPKTDTADAFQSSSELEKKDCLSQDLLSPTSDDDDDEGYTFIVRQPGNTYRVTFGDDEEREEESRASESKSLASGLPSDCTFESSGFTSENRLLPIVKKGQFADDCYFENVRPNYSQAVREVLEKANEWSCQSDAMHNYRKLRQRKIKLENQAVNVSEDSKSHKIVIDVLDFTGGDVTVQLVKGKELLVEGQAEKQDGSRVSRVSFVRRFALPDLVERDAISCVLSSDGILTIISKKKNHRKDF
ncbi:uncharacterized protein LOC122267832 [Penaeus japonicus]|uniref:uncharacterized protein LOC122267832 n=1 Tax=Penaeus japonicus TaxID=27405 RepID=UPI001C712519|nr:uncharacterized protein LOC122267832 [Penaeus japonicus]